MDYIKIKLLTEAAGKYLASRKKNKTKKTNTYSMYRMFSELTIVTPEQP